MTMSVLNRPTNAKKKRAPRSSFVVTVGAAAAAVAISACSTVTTNPPELECPAERPVAGEDCVGDLACSYPDACSVDYVCGEDEVWVDNSPPCNPPPPCEERLDEPCTTGETCEGEDYGCGPTPLVCIDGVWVDEGLSCNPPPPCPEALPTEGDPCPADFGTPEDCFYQVDTACGPTEIEATCVQASPDASSVWQHVVPPCDPQVPDCDGYESDALCQADISCRWLVPGCADPPSEFPSGCYPAADCDSYSCDANTTCQLVVADPCFGKKCDACAGDASLCLPP